MTNPDKKLVEIRERLEKTTPGEWKFHRDLGFALVNDKCEPIASPQPNSQQAWISWEREEDKEFIAYIKSDIKYLLEQVERLKMEDFGKVSEPALYGDIRAHAYQVELENVHLKEKVRELEIDFLNEKFAHNEAIKDWHMYQDKYNEAFKEVCKLQFQLGKYKAVVEAAKKIVLVFRVCKDQQKVPNEKSYELIYDFNQLLAKLEKGE